METINTYYDNYVSLEKFIKDNHELLLTSDNSAVMVQVFSGVCDENYLLAISKQLRVLIPNAQVIGTTTSGEIMNGLVSGLKTVLSFSVFRHSDIKVVFAEKKYGDDYELGQSIATTLNSDKARVLILFATGLKVNASQLLKGVQSVNADLPVAGGNAGDNRTNTQRFVCCNEDITNCGVVGVALDGDNLTVTCHSHLGWQPIGKEMTITRAEGSRVYTIDHIPAYQVYCQYLGINTNSNIFKVVEFPLTIFKHGLNIARAPFLRYDDDSIGFFGDIAEGEKVRFSFGHVETIIEKIDNLLQIIKQQPVESIFVYSCASRRGFLQEAAQIETLPLQNIAPTAGFFTSGEFFHTDSSNQLLNTTMTTLALSESSGDKGALTTEPKAKVFPGEPGSQITAIKDNVADRSIEILRALTCLVNTVTNELDVKTAELQMVNEQIQQAREAAEAANQAKSRFLANVSHEIRTPLAGIIGMTDLLMDTPLNRSQKDFANSVLESSLHLHNIINEILDFSKIEAGKLTIKETPFELNSLLKRVISSESAQLGKKELKMISFIDPAIPQYLFGDPIRLTQVLLNLTGNAIKFTDQGRITIQAFLEIPADSDLLIRFEINDTGIGIAREDQDNLFFPFMQVDNSTTRAYGGTGLGLVISRQLVTLMGGDIGFNSELGKGSTFWFTLPCKEASFISEQTEKDSLLAERNDINGHELKTSTCIAGLTHRVLLVEDDPVCRKVANLQLDKLGITVDLADNGEEAIKATRSHDYSLILMDCHMPVMDGFSATRAIRGAELEHSRHVPIIAMTARALEEDKDLCAAAGMDDYLSKPFDSRKLFNIIKKWLPGNDL